MKISKYPCHIISAFFQILSILPFKVIYFLGFSPAFLYSI